VGGGTKLYVSIVVLAAAGCVETAPGGAGNVGAGGAAGDAGTVADRGSPGATIGSADSGGSGGASPASGFGGTTRDAAPVPDGSAIDTAATVETGAEPHDFVCSEMIGLWVASQWWGSFEMGVDNARWQFMFQHHGYLELFADPASQFWQNGIMSKCAAQSATPDRVIFLPFSLTLKTFDEWHTQLTKVVETMKGKFPGVRRIELITTLRSPNNMLCANDMDPGTIVSPAVDDAIRAVADESGGLVAVGPKIELPDCAWWAGGTDLTGQGNTGIGRLIAAYYSAQP
jgi:hypothetical protein